MLAVVVVVIVVVVVAGVVVVVVLYARMCTRGTVQIGVGLPCQS